jgi:hypothetical protein
MRTRVVLLGVAAIGIATYQAERDCVLTNVVLNTACNTVVSTNPSLTFAIVTAASAQFRLDLISAHPSVTQGYGLGVPINFPISAGEKIFVHFAAGGSATLYLEDAAEPLAT